MHLEHLRLKLGRFWTSKFVFSTRKYMRCLEYTNTIVIGKKMVLCFCFGIYRVKRTLSSVFIHRGEQRGYKSLGFNMKLSGSALQCLHFVDALSRGHLYPTQSLFYRDT